MAQGTGLWQRGPHNLSNQQQRNQDVRGLRPSLRCGRPSNICGEKTMPITRQVARMLVEVAHVGRGRQEGAYAAPGGERNPCAESEYALVGVCYCAPKYARERPLLSRIRTL